MCSRDDDPSQHDAPRTDKALPYASPWVRSALAHTLPALARGEPVEDVLRRTLPPVTFDGPRRAAHK